jgi:tetratricopeptide (TPR) repeat protein
MCAVVPDFDEDLEEVHRLLMAELKELLVKSPNSSECQWRTAIIYRGWALAVLPNSAHLSTAEHALREAITLYEKLSLSDPKLPDIWLNLANSSAYLGDVQRRLARQDDAAAAFRRAMQIYDEHGADLTVNPIADVIVDHARIACYLAKMGWKDEANVVLQKAMIYAQRLTASNASAITLYGLAVAQARLGDKAGYRATCKALVELPPGDASDLTKSKPIWSPSLTPDAFDRPIWVPLLAADAVDDPSVHVNRVEEFVAHNRLIQPHFRLCLLGAARYRAGQCERAADDLEASIAAYPNGPNLHGLDTINYHRLFLAMTKWQLGERDAARRQLAETLPAVEQELQTASIGWSRRATLEILRREAEDLIGQREANEAVENEGRSSDAGKERLPLTTNH